MLRAIDFFCGAGGMTNGLLQAGLNVLAGIDNHLPCKLTYEYPGNNPRPDGSLPVFLDRDVDDFTADQLAEAVGIVPGDDDLVFAGCSPCQYWTKIATSRKKSEASRLLLHRFRYFIEAFRPGYLVVENVPGLLARQEEAGLVEFLSFLEEADYAFDHKVVTAYQYGVPQKRRRYILVATRVADSIKLPPPDRYEGAFPQNRTVGSVLGVGNGFPKINAGHRDPSPFLHSASILSAENLKRIRLTLANGGTRVAWRDDPDLLIDAYRGRDDCFRDVYGRMSWDEPAPTITTRFNSLSNGRFGHPEEDRAISLREGATLQTFGKSYVFVGNQAEIARQIGNAVPPELGRRIGVCLLEHQAAHNPAAL